MNFQRAMKKTILEVKRALDQDLEKLKPCELCQGLRATFIASSQFISAFGFVPSGNSFHVNASSSVINSSHHLSWENFSKNYFAFCGNHIFNSTY